MAEITSAKAMARTVRVSPRKTRLVLDLIRGKNVADAIAILKFTPNKAARIVEKTLNSAIANAENNFGLEKANLVVSETFANEGPTMKRFRPRAKGSASPINKRTTHVTVFDQITRYNMVLKVDYLIVSNGLNHYCCHIDYNTKTYLFLPEIPHYSEL